MDRDPFQARLDELGRGLDAVRPAAGPAGGARGAGSPGGGLKVVTELLAGVLGGLLLGWLASRFLGWGPLAIVGGVLLGAISAMWQVIRPALKRPGGGKG